ncbi:MAG: hypothetical protein NTY09_15545 [bacterium]|nr:hypothetical protein [bacterium]
MSDCPPFQEPMILDASVLIDFVKADRSILKLVVKNVGSLYVVDAVLGEVNQINHENELVEIGVRVIEPDMKDVDEASQMSGPTSFQDHLCYLTARRIGYVCVTNDRNLRRLCMENHVTICWGLELLIKLHKAGGISTERSIELVELIHHNNPRHINIKLVNRFKQAIGDSRSDES